MRNPLGRVTQLRGHRQVRDRTEPIGDSVASLRAHIERAARRTGDFAAAWQAVIPSELVDQSRIESVRGGSARVVVPTSAVMYEIDRLLRDGAEAEVRRRMMTTLSRIRLVIGPLNDPAMPSQ